MPAVGRSTPRCAAVRALRNLWYQQINLDGPHNHQFILSTNDTSSTSRLFIWIFVIISLLTSATMFTILHICHVWSNSTLARYSLLFIRILYSHFPSPAHSLKTGTVSHLRHQTLSNVLKKFWEDEWSKGKESTWLAVSLLRFAVYFFL